MKEYDLHLLIEMAFEDAWNDVALANDNWMSVSREEEFKFKRTLLSVLKADLSASFPALAILTPSEYSRHFSDLLIDAKLDS